MLGMKPKVLQPGSASIVRLENHLPQRQWHFQFLGTPVTVHSNTEKATSALLEKLLITLSKAAAALCTSCQPETEPLQYRDAVYPRPTLDQTLASLPTFWFEKQLNTLVTRYLEWLTGLAKFGNTTNLFLSRSKRDSNYVTYQTSLSPSKRMCGRMGGRMCANTSSLVISRHPLVCPWQHRGQTRRQAFTPYQQVKVMEDGPRKTKTCMPC